MHDVRSARDNHPRPGLGRPIWNVITNEIVPCLFKGGRGLIEENAIIRSLWLFNLPPFPLLPTAFLLYDIELLVLGFIVHVSIFNHYM